MGASSPGKLIEFRAIHSRTSCLTTRTRPRTTCIFTRMLKYDSRVTLVGPSIASAVLWQHPVDKNPPARAMRHEYGRPSGSIPGSCSDLRISGSPWAGTDTPAPGYGSFLPVTAKPQLRVRAAPDVVRSVLRKTSCG